MCAKSASLSINMRNVLSVAHRLAAVESQAGSQHAQAKSASKSGELRSDLRIVTTSSGTWTKKWDHLRH
jgi:hypothetical protein